jgi:tRNA (guanine10-N2)-dimethyltransferase
MNKCVFILGRQPNLGIAELERVIGHENISVINDSVAAADQEIDNSLIKRLGGTQKIGQILAETSNKSWPEIEDFIKSDILPSILSSIDGKINLGVSCYGIRVKPTQINGSNIALKKIIKANERSIRIIPNKEPQLSTAQVLHNQLIGEHGFELLIIAAKSGLVFAKTIAIQDINGYANRDQNRPKRDARVGMLPPKLAQIMINLANPKESSWVIDPFCGTGVILQEALLMGFKTLGSDIEKRMIEYSRENLEWLAVKFDNLPDWSLEIADATNHHWDIDINSVVCETLLGKPLSQLPPPVELRQDSEKLDKLIRKFLENLAPQLKVGCEVCVAIPAWVTNSGFITLPLLDHLEKIGYNRMSFKNVDTNDLIYFRPNQLVARQLLVLSRK